MRLSTLSARLRNIVSPTGAFLFSLPLVTIISVREHYDVIRIGGIFLFLSIAWLYVYRLNDREEKRRLQLRLDHTEKLASLGTLAAGVAHEVNNPLAIIKGNISILEDMLSEAGHIAAYRDILQRQMMAVDRIAVIVNGLRTFARADTDHIQPIDINKVITETIALVDQIYRKTRCSVMMELRANPGTILGNIGKTQQIIMNLVSNARDAITEQNRDGVIRVQTTSSGQKLILEVSDNGCGIPKDNLRRLFDPFFTTKPPGRGTGLGLSIIHNIVGALGGTIDVQSTVGVGTTFTVTLPLAKPGITIPSKAPADIEEPRMLGSALIVDDEPGIREILHRDLAAMGLTVEEAANGETALVMLRRNPDFDFVIVDVKMPEMSGDQLLRKAHEERLLRKNFILITGGTVTDYTLEQLDIIKTLASGYLTKPFNRNELFDVLKFVRDINRSAQCP